MNAILIDIQLDMFGKNIKNSIKCLREKANNFDQVLCSFNKKKSIIRKLLR